MVDGYFDEDLQSYAGHFGGQIQSLEFGGTDPGRGFLGGTRWSLAPTGGPLAAAFGLRGRVVLGPITTSTSAAASGVARAGSCCARTCRTSTTASSSRRRSPTAPASPHRR